MIRLSLMVLFTTLIGSTLMSVPVFSAVDEVRDIAEKFQQTKQNLIETEVEKRKILGTLYGINQRMKKIIHEKSHLTDEMIHVQDNVRNIAKLIAGLEVRIEKQKVQLKKRLRALYKLSGEGYVGIIFSRVSMTELDETLKFLKIVTDKDYQLIRSYQENIAAYKHQRKKLKNQIGRLVSIERQIKKQEGLLVAEHKVKSKIVSDLDKNRVATLTRIKTLRSKTQALKERNTPGNDEWEDLMRPSIFEQKGQLHSPIQGVVIQDFGLITDERYKTQLSHKGWKYAAPKGTPVQAIFEGTVIHSSFVKGYGYTIIVDHGDHYYSVYAHTSRPKVSVGDNIKRNEVIAEAGNTQRGLGEGIYFEIRHFSEPENPTQWLVEKKMQISDTRYEFKADVARAEHQED